MQFQYEKADQVKRDYIMKLFLIQTFFLSSILSS